MSDFDIEEYEENLKGAKAYRLFTSKINDETIRRV